MLHYTIKLIVLKSKDNIQNNVHIFWTSVIVWANPPKKPLNLEYFQVSSSLGLT